MRQPICVLAIAAAIALGCGGQDKSTAPEIEIYRPQTSIANVLHNLIEAYERQDIVAYEKLFADEFFFAFDPQEVAEDPDLPMEWSREKDMLSTRNMFEAPLVENITLDFVVEDPTAATPLDEVSHPFPPGTMKTVVSEVELMVDTRDPEGGENIVYPVTGDQAIFFLYPHPTETAGGLPVWHIVEWRDRTLGLLARDLGHVTATASVTVDVSWGGIKHLYR